jgi:hypothetical protein
MAYTFTELVELVVEAAASPAIPGQSWDLPPVLCHADTDVSLLAAIVKALRERVALQRTKVRAAAIQLHADNRKLEALRVAVDAVRVKAIERAGLSEPTADENFDDTGLARQVANNMRRAMDLSGAEDKA